MLARLEAIRIEQELKTLREEQKKLQDILGSAAALKRTLIREIEQDTKAHGDARRTLIQADKRTVAKVKVVDEAVTVIISLKGWVRTQKGQEVDAAALAFKPGDALYGTFACRSVDPLLVFGAPTGGDARIYSVAVASLPGGRGDGVPITSLIDLAAGTQPAHYFAGAADATLLLTNTAGFGLLARAADMLGRNKGGKSFLTVEAGAHLLPPVVVAAANARVGCLALDGRLLVIPLEELKRQSNGGKGLTLMDVEPKLPLVSVATFADSLRVLDMGRGGKPKDEQLKGAALAEHLDKRARKGRKVDGVLKVLRLLV